MHIKVRKWLFNCCCYLYMWTIGNAIVRLCVTYHNFICVCLCVINLLSGQFWLLYHQHFPQSIIMFMCACACDYQFKIKKKLNKTWSTGDSDTVDICLQSLDSFKFTFRYTIRKKTDHRRPWWFKSFGPMPFWANAVCVSPFDFSLVYNQSQPSAIQLYITNFVYAFDYNLIFCHINSGRTVITFVYQCIHLLFECIVYYVIQITIYINLFKSIQHQF